MKIHLKKVMPTEEDVSQKVAGSNSRACKDTQLEQLNLSHFLQLPRGELLPVMVHVAF